MLRRGDQPWSEVLRGASNCFVTARAVIAQGYESKAVAVRESPPGRSFWLPSGSLLPRSTSKLLIIRLFQQPAKCTGVPRQPFLRTLRQFQSDIATEDACQQYLAACRWPNRFRCPLCGHQRAYELVKQRRRQRGKVSAPSFVEALGPPFIGRRFPWPIGSGRHI